MPFKVVFFFDNAENGWSETYYNSASDQNTAFAQAQALLTKREDLMAVPTKAIGVRISDEANPRASSLTPLNEPSTGNYDSQADNPQTAAMMRLYSGSQTRTRALYLRGSPDNAYDLALPNNVDAQLWIQRFVAFGQILVNGNWLIKFRPRPSSGNKIVITNWSPETPSTNSLLALLTPITGTPTFVDCYKIKGLPFAPGQCLLLSFSTVAPFIATIRYRTPADYVYPGGGYLVVYQPAYDAITSFAATPRFTRRATGRPFDVSRGRRRSIAR